MFNDYWEDSKGTPIEVPYGSPSTIKKGNLADDIRVLKESYPYKVFIETSGPVSQHTQQLIRFALLYQAALDPDYTTLIFQETSCSISRY